jgi:hypothetical protein
MPPKPPGDYSRRGPIIAWVVARGISRFSAKKAFREGKIDKAKFGGKRNYYVVASAEAYFFPSAAATTSTHQP